MYFRTFKRIKNSVIFFSCCAIYSSCWDAVVVVGLVLVFLVVASYLRRRSFHCGTQLFFDFACKVCVFRVFRVIIIYIVVLVGGHNEWWWG